MIEIIQNKIKIVKTLVKQNTCLISVNKYLALKTCTKIRAVFKKNTKSTNFKRFP